MSTGHADTNPAQGLSLGDDASFDAVFRQYFPALCHFAGQLLPPSFSPEDLVIDCFVHLWHRRITLNHAAATKTFLYTMVRRACRDLRQKKHLATTALADAGETIAADTDLIGTIIRSETLRLLYAKAETLPFQLRQVFQLHFIDGLSEREISAALGTSYHTVRGQRLRAITLLKEKMRTSEK